MSVESGLDEVQSVANASADAVKEARRRRGVFRTGLGKAPDVAYVFPSGSLARGTHKDPIHDVDLVVVYKAEGHPDWGVPGPSVEAALEHARQQIKDCLGTNGSDGEEVRRCDLKNHSVKCFLDDPGDPDAFTVDVVPALEHPEFGLWIPERNSGIWVRSHPKFLIEQVAERHAEWNQFAKLVRVLKRWNADHGNTMKSLVVEVLALEHLPALDRPDALARFFTAAATAVWSPIEDPAHLCGEIQPDLDRAAAAAALADAAEHAAKAVDHQADGASRAAMCEWRKVFGSIFPEPPGGCGELMPGLIPAVPKRKIVDAPQG